MAANYVLIKETTLNASAASVTLGSIPQTGYTDLKVVVSYRTNESQTIGPACIQFNGATTGYSSKELYGSGSGVGSAYRAVLNNGMYLGNGVGGSATANTFGNMEIYIPNYTSANYKSVSIDNVGEDNATAAYATMIAGLWSNTAAITSILLYPYSGSTNFVAGSSFSLYGIAALGTTPIVGPSASGGDIVTNDGTYWYHTFLSSGTFIPNKALTCDYLVIAGGGAGGGTGNGTNQGYSGGGGGGAGGFRYATSQALTIGTEYLATVGAGGSAGTYLASTSTNGGNSSFNSITSAGGGGVVSGTGQNGGSGGGSYGNGTVGLGNTPSVSPSQGNNSTQTSGSGGSGGGGGGAVAGSSSSNAGANGGAGLNAYSSWATATGTGASGYYSGGGGGGAYGMPSSNTGGTGGLGGGGNGGGTGFAIAGAANTGGGGGGAYLQSLNVGNTGGAGGSGIVIVRYSMT